MKSEEFEEEVAKLSEGYDCGVSCVGMGTMSGQTEAQLLEVEVTLLGKFGRGVRKNLSQFLLLTAVGGSSSSWITPVKVMGMKEENIIAMEFEQLAIFCPGIIVGNANTPRWLSWIMQIVPGSWGNVEQEDVAKSFRAHLEKKSEEKGVIRYHNDDMRELCRLID
jgi:hypothetical protein